MSITNPVFSGRLKTLATLGAALFVSAGVAAQTVVDQTAAAQTAETQAWRTQLTPYVWMTGLQGHIQPVSGAPTVHVDKSFSDVLENLDAAFFVSGSARKDRWVLHGDFSHASTSDGASLPLGLSARAKVRQSSLTLTGGYNWQLAPQSSVDLMGGVRVWDIHAHVQVPGVAAAQSNTSFVDPVVAVRWRYDLGSQWYLQSKPNLPPHTLPLWILLPGYLIWAALTVMALKSASRQSGRGTVFAVLLLVLWGFLFVSLTRIFHERVLVSPGRWCTCFSYRYYHVY